VKKKKKKKKKKKGSTYRRENTHRLGLLRID